MKSKILYLIVIAGWLAAACKDGSNPTGNSDNQPPALITVSVDITGLDPVLIWTAAADPEGDPVTYSVLLEGEEVQAGLSDTTATLRGLEYKTEFSGRVVASDGNGGSSEAEFMFISREIRVEWEVNLGGGEYDIATSIQQTSDEGYIVAGWSRSLDGDVTGNNGDYDYWIVKMDANGGLVWEKSLGGSGFDRANSIQQTSEGGYVVAGYSGSTDGDVSDNNGGSDYWIVKLNAEGSLIWEENLGGGFIDEANTIQQTFDRGYIVAGWANSVDGDVTGNHGGYDYWIVKLDANGMLVWEKSFGGSATFEEAFSIQQTSEGGYIVAGKSESKDGDVTGNNGINDYWIVKIDANGELIWEENLGGSGEDLAFSIQPASDGGFVVAGYSESQDGDVGGTKGQTDYWIVKLR